MAIFDYPAHAAAAWTVTEYDAWRADAMAAGFSTENCFRITVPVGNHSPPMTLRQAEQELIARHNRQLVALALLDGKVEYVFSDAPQAYQTRGAVTWTPTDRIDGQTPP